MTTIGLVLGIALAVGTGRFVNTMLYGPVANDVTMVVVAAVALGAAAALAGSCRHGARRVSIQ